MFNSQKSVSYMVYILVIMVIVTSSVSCGKKQPAEEVAIRINNYSMSVEEFNAVFSEVGSFEDTPKARQDFLDNMITRKLILQNAERTGLDKEKDFLKSIENFWQQSLLKITVDRKMKKIERNLLVTEEEVKEAYTRWSKENPGQKKSLQEMHEIIEGQLLRLKQSLALSAWIKDLRDNAHINIDKKALRIE